jgi:hypothetical protein
MTDHNTKTRSATPKAIKDKQLADGAAAINKAKAEAAARPKAKAGTSWRDFYQVHRACDAWPQLPPDQRKALKADMEANFVKVPIQTRQVAGESVTYVIDGRTRLDLMEELDRQVVNEKGEWTGALIDKVEHSTGRTHEQIGKEVISYNGHRRHVLSKQQLADSIVATLMAAREMAGKDDLSVTQRSFSPTPGKRGGSTKDELKAEAIKQAQAVGSSEHAVQRALAKARPPAPSKPRKSTKPKPEFIDVVHKKWRTFITSASFPHDERKRVREVICPFTALTWAQSKREGQIIQKFMTFMGKQSRSDEVLKLIGGFIKEELAPKK